MLTSNDLARFWAKVFKHEGEDACWEWTATVDKHGYGRFYHPEYGTRAAHLVGYEIGNNRVPEKGLVVKHECDNTRCVRPSHLIADTQLQNMRDATARMRVSGAKVTVEKVREIRELHAGGMLMVDLAIEFDLTPQAISNIVKRKTWKNVP